MNRILALISAALLGLCIFLHLSTLKVEKDLRVQSEATKILAEEKVALQSNIALAKVSIDIETAVVDKSKVIQAKTNDLIKAAPKVETCEDLGDLYNQWIIDLEQLRATAKAYPPAPSEIRDPSTP